MRKLRTALTAVATASMVLATTGAAFAQSSSSWESRADFVFQLDKSLGIQPVYPATPDFQDVSTTSPYYGYIEAAFQDGITNGIAPGIFGPSLGITRAEAAKYLVIAFGAGAAAANITSTSFSDNGDIPTALVGYVGEAAALGLMKGFPGGTFNPDGNLTVTQEGYLLSQLTSAMSSLTLKVTASSSDVAPGQPVTLSTSASTASGAKVASPIVTYSVTGTNASDALLSGNTFVGSAAGNYTVQAASGTATATTTVAVYGAAVGLKVNAPTTVVANGASTVTVTADVVDANGNTVGSNSDQISLSTGGTTAVAGFLNGLTLSDLGSANAVNGVATFTLTAGNVAGANETLTATDGALTAGTATISGTAQVPTSLSVSAASPYLTANQSLNGDVLSASVLDQTGNPMVSGAYTVSFAVTSGPANFGGSATAAGVYYGPGATPAPAKATLNDVQGSTGAIVVTASATGLTAGTANVTAVIAGAPAQIAVSAGQTVSADTAASTGATYTVTLEDSHGYPAVATGTETINVTDSSTALVNPVSILVGNDSGKFTVNDTTVGSYTLTAADSAGLLTSGTSTETVTAGAAAVIAATPDTSVGTVSTMYVPVNSPTFTVSAQLQDNEGNAVSEAGVPLTFLVKPSAGNDGTGTITASGGSATTTAKSAAPVTVTADTNASGVATATVTAQGYTTDNYTVAVTGSIGTTALAPDVTAAMTLGQNVTASTTLTVKTTAAPVVPVSSMTSGSTYNAFYTQADTYGNPVTAGDLMLVALGGTGTAILAGPGVANLPGTNDYMVDGTLALGTFTITPKLAGSLTVSIQDLQVYNAATTTSALAVTPGTDVSAVTFSSGGTLIPSTGMTVTPGTAYPITVTAVDAGGNPVVAVSTIPVTITGSAGEYRLGSATGTDEGATVTVDIPMGQTSATVYYIPTVTTATFSGAIAYLTLAGTNAPILTGAGTTTVTFTFTDANSTALANVAVTFGDGGAGGTFSAATGITNSLGQVSVSYTTPTTGSPITVPVTAAVQGVAAPVTETASVFY